MSESVKILVKLDADNNDTLDIFKTQVKINEKKVGFNKVQALNRIIREWREDRIITLDIKKKPKKI